MARKEYGKYAANSWWQQARRPGTKQREIMIELTVMTISVVLLSWAAVAIQAHRAEHAKAQPIVVSPQVSRDDVTIYNDGDEATRPANSGTHERLATEGVNPQQVASTPVLHMSTPSTAELAKRDEREFSTILNFATDAARNGASKAADQIGSVMKATEAASDYVFADVQPGQVLSVIAQQVLGNANAYNGFEYLTSSGEWAPLPDPNKIIPGQQLRAHKIGNTLPA